ncbi:MAG: hypothetical protein HGA75_01140 [Thiobacillus sp.]|nr:hypothetical protein [Thiobacillus sp.]
MKMATRSPTEGESLLERDFPHIAERLAQAWVSPEAAEHLLNALLVDDRDNRHGFPPEVFEELMFISDLNWKRRHFNDDGVEILPESFGFGAL